MEVDGSILASKSVDASYTPFTPIKTTEVEPGVTETHYNGVFLGAEKVWIGDPLRLQLGSGTDILVLHAIIERKLAPGPNQPAPNSSIHLTGDVYAIQQVPHSDPNVPTPASPANNPELPQRLTEDLAFRNAKSIAAQRVASFWKLTAANARVELKDIKGRWYEASIILQILQPKVFEESARNGEIREATLWMNSRGDCLTANRSRSLPTIKQQNNFKHTRREAFGRALPPNAEIRDGLEPPLPDNVDPALEGMTSQSSMDIDPRFDTEDNMDTDEIRVSRPGDVSHSSGIDEFMNLDGMDEHPNSQQMPGFGQEYSQGPSQGYY